ncbi:hypothetical protein LJC63_08905, partial [Ruminococcaceae bacterium OttesenSCG-928-L11]|nr:hypothetical protein [Ruminococcaceae bacterium OttesenSCG-928-L11]
VRHLQDGIRGKSIRNLRAYCRMSLYNWLVELPLRERTAPQNTASAGEASYALAELERLVEDGDFGGR